MRILPAILAASLTVVMLAAPALASGNVNIVAGPGTTPRRRPTIP